MLLPLPVDLYKALVRPLLLADVDADPEWMSQQAIAFLAGLHRSRDGWPTKLLRSQLRNACSAPDPSLEQSLWGLNFANPVGLAAGFDKNGLAAEVWPDLGFGFAEVGTVTFHAQPGNPQPRLFRLPEDLAALNRMGFNNEGAAAMAERLRASVGVAPHPVPLGVNLGKSKVTALADAPADYIGSFRLLRDLGDYFVINVSSPNTPGLRDLQASRELEPILAGLQAENHEGKPLLVKIAPDLSDEDVIAVVELARAQGMAGIIATNTTIRRDQLKTRTLARTGNPIDQEAGGISGAPVRQRSTEVIRLIHGHTGGSLPIIGVGGIFSAEDAWAKITAGASLVQVYTGWIYEGPGLVREIQQGLSQRLRERGFTRLQQAIGCER
mgnify:CR=1 FL=1